MLDILCSNRFTSLFNCSTTIIATNIGRLDKAIGYKLFNLHVPDLVTGLGIPPREYSTSPEFVKFYYSRYPLVVNVSKQGQSMKKASRQTNLTPF